MSPLTRWRGKLLEYGNLFNDLRKDTNSTLSLSNGAMMNGILLCFPEMVEIR